MGLTATRLVQDPLAVTCLDNRLNIHTFFQIFSFSLWFFSFCVFIYAFLEISSLCFAYFFGVALSNFLEHFHFLFVFFKLYFIQSISTSFSLILYVCLLILFYLSLCLFVAKLLYKHFIQL